MTREFEPDPPTSGSSAPEAPASTSPSTAEVDAVNIAASAAQYFPGLVVNMHDGSQYTTVDTDTEEGVTGVTVVPASSVGALSGQNK